MYKNLRSCRLKILPLNDRKLQPDQEGSISTRLGLGNALYGRVGPRAIRVRNCSRSRSGSNVNPMAFRGVCRGANGAIILSMFDSQARVGTRVGGVRVYTFIINACMDMRVLVVLSKVFTRDR